LPVAAIYLHCSFDRHADHSLKAMNGVKVLAVVDTSAGLDDIRSILCANLLFVSTSLSESE
jgi:hypothetical protein